MEFFLSFFLWLYSFIYFQYSFYFSYFFLDFYFLFSTIDLLFFLSLLFFLFLVSIIILLFFLILFFLSYFILFFIFHIWYITRFTGTLFYSNLNNQYLPIILHKYSRWSLIITDIYIFCTWFFNVKIMLHNEIITQTIIIFNKLLKQIYFKNRKKW